MYSFTLRLTSIVLLTIALTSTRASAWGPIPQDAPDAPPPKEPADKPETITPPEKDPKAADEPKLQLQSKSKSELMQERKAKADAVRKAAAKRRQGQTDTSRASAAKKRKAKANFKLNPDAKWSCDQPTATLAPVWRGEKTLTFPFLIRNNGTADLLIRAKGG